MKKHSVYLGIAWILLAGCSQQLVKTTEQPPIVKTVSSPEAGETLTDDEVLYRLLLAEIAGQRGYLDVSIENLLLIAAQIRDARVAERATRAAIYAKDYSAALTAAKLWVELSPDHTEAHQVVAALALREGDKAVAINSFRKILALDTSGVDQGFLVVAGLLGREAKQQSTLALSIMDELVETHQSNPYALFAYGNLAMLFAEHALAEAKLKAALEIKPDLFQAIILHARVTRSLGEVEKAIEELKAAVATYPENDKLRLAYSRMLLNTKRYPEAKTQFEVLLSKSPDNPDLMYTLALLSLDMDLHEEASEHLNRLLDLGKRVSEAQYYLGRIAEVRRQYPDAIKAYFKVNQGEYRLDAQIRIAQLLARLERVDEARSHLQALRAKNKEPSMMVRFYLAETDVLATAGKYQAAVDLLTDALQNIPGNIDLLYSRGLLYEKLDRIDLLENDLRAVLLREPENADALNALGYTLADRTERYQEAYELIQQALRLKPNSAPIIDSMGWVLYRLGRPHDALEYLQRALNLEYDAEIAAHLSEVLWVTGDHQGAESVLKQALEKTPDDEHLLNMIKQLKKEQF